MLFVWAALILGLVGSHLGLALPSSRQAHDTSQVSSAPPQNCLDAQETNELLATATSLLQQSRFADAAALLQSKAQDRCEFASDLLLAAAFDGEGATESAKQTLRQAVLLWPSNTSLATSLARDELRDGNLTAARQAIAHCKPTEQTPQRELRMIAVVYLESHDLTHALNAAQLAWRAHPSQENLLFTANVLQLEGRSTDVVSLMEKYRDQYGDSPGFLVTIGESESDQKLYPAAERDLKRAVALAPESYPAHYVLGHLQVAKGDLAEGIQEYKKAISLSPRQPRTYCQLGRALAENDDIAQAQRYFEQALSLDPQYEPAYFERGKLELRTNELQKAANDLVRAIQINPASQRSYYLLIQAYGRLGEHNKAQLVKQQWAAYKQSHPLLPVGTPPESPEPEMATVPGSPTFSTRP